MTPWRRLRCPLCNRGQKYKSLLPCPDYATIVEKLPDNSPIIQIGAEVLAAEFISPEKFAQYVRDCGGARSITAEDVIL